MVEQGSITRLIADLESGDAEAARLVWDKYFHRLVGLARQSLGGRQWGGIDEEDVALSAMNSFFARHGEAGFPKMDSRDDLWRLLAVITRRKSLNVIRRERALRRGGGRRANLSVELLTVFSQAPTPDQAAEFLDEVRRLLNDVLGTKDPALRTIAAQKLEGADNVQIAKKLGVARRTIERKLELIRMLCERDVEERDAAHLS